jgi:hypothetical protein
MRNAVSRAEEVSSIHPCLQGTATDDVSGRTITVTHVAEADISTVLGWPIEPWLVSRGRLPARWFPCIPLRLRLGHSVRGARPT